MTDVIAVEFAAAEMTTPSVSTMAVDFYTVERRETGEALGQRGPLDWRQVFVTLRRMGKVRREEWQVRGWRRDRVYEENRPPVDAYLVAFEVSAGHFRGRGWR